MNEQQPSDDELAERVARGDWTSEVEAPDLRTVTRLVAQRRHRRRSAYVGGAGLAAAAVVAVVVAVQPLASSSGDPDLPAATRSDGPTAASSPDPAPAPPNCSRGSRLVVTDGPLGGTPARPTKQVYLGNLSAGDCVLRHLPTLSVDLVDGPRTAVDMRSAAAGPWVLKPDRGLLFTVAAPARSSCMQSSPLSTQLTLSYEGYEYTLPFSGMRVLNCAPPILSELRVAPSPGN